MAPAASGQGRPTPPEVTASGAVRVQVRLEGIVQGVGFRPYVHALATALGLAGVVGNDSRGVFVEAEGDEATVTRFLRSLEHEAPPLAVVERISTQPLPPTGAHGFVIAVSPLGGQRSALVPPDVATCDACLTELFDPRDRRYRYAFTNCTSCGPRFSIIEDIPYDRPATTMAGFRLCDECTAEYDDPSDRRFHAQPVCCPACGPTLSLLGRSGRELAVAGRLGDPVVAAAELLSSGQVVAVKGLGGYHLAALASDETAVAALRARKRREARPFAVMAPDLQWARRLGRVGEREERLLTGWRHPIVLLDRSGGRGPIAASVAPRNRSIGVMLPYTPLHHLLAAELGAPVVLTSGNLSDEPIAYLDDDARDRLGEVADAFLVHDRPIRTRVDDSVVRLWGDVELPIRRSRGYAPMPLHLSAEVPRPVLGCGAQLKATFCLASGQRALLSQHIGDLESWETLRSYREGITHFQSLFQIRPEVLAHDLHPEYLSTKWALEQAAADPELVLSPVQHHHAHLASCLADNGEEGPVIGVVFDGLGYGTDGSLWGGEVLVADLVGFDREAHLDPVTLPGGTAAVREPWRMALSWLERAYGDGLPAGLGVRERWAERWPAVLDMARRGLNSPPTSSVGRLFDAVSSLCGIRDVVTYEGQAAVELEQASDPDEPGAYKAGIRLGSPILMVGADMIRAVVDDLLRGVPAATVGGRFHNGLADAVSDLCAATRARTGLTTVALSGGVFQNVLLLDRVVGRLRGQGLRVLTHGRVPPNDGGISLGQVAVAGARLASI